MSQTKIESLTQEQIDKFPTYVDKWLKIGLSTDDCDRKKAEHWASEAYKVAGLNQPKMFIWSDDPIKSVISRLIVGEIIKTGRRVWGDLWDKVRHKVWTLARVHVQAKSFDQVEVQVRHHVSKQVRHQVRRKIWAEAVDQVEDQVWAQVGDQVWDLVRDQVYGCHDSDWLSFYSFMLNELHIKCCENLIPLMKLAEDCGWWAPYENVCFLQEKPKTINMLDGVLHAENGPAIEYRGENSLKIWALWGVRVPQWLAETPLKELDKNKILEIEDKDIMEVGLKRYDR